MQIIPFGQLNIYKDDLAEPPKPGPNVSMDDDGTIHITDMEWNEHILKRIGLAQKVQIDEHNWKVVQLTAQPIEEGSDEWIKDQDIKLTTPNLHRRVDPQEPTEESEEAKPRDYSIKISNKDSYRTTTKYLKNVDEDGNELEIP